MITDNRNWNNLDNLDDFELSLILKSIDDENKEFLATIDENDQQVDLDILFPRQCD